MSRTLEDVRDNVKQRLTCPRLFLDLDLADLAQRGNSWRGWFKLYESQSKNGLVVWDQSWYCHSSHKHGDVIDIAGYKLFGENWRNTGDQFIRALQDCAQRAGVDWVHVTEEQKRAAAQKRNLYDWLTKIAHFYHEQLTPQRRAFLHDRYGLTDETIDSLKIGWATPDWDRLAKWLLAEGLTEAQALKTGLVTRAKNGNLVDFYRGRLVFPYWEAGRVVYSIARQTDETPAWIDEKTGKDRNPKYIKQKVHSDDNPQVSEFIRNDFFYYEDVAWGANELYLTEGVTDCILANQEGFLCISPVTVHFKKQDWPRLLHLVKNVQTLYIAFDNEDNEAGAKGALETAKHLWEHGHNPLLVTIPRPDGTVKVDLNDYLREHGGGAFDEAVKGAQSLIDVTIADIEQAPQRQRAPRIDNELVPLLADVYDTAAFPPYSQKVKERLGLALGDIRRFVKEHARAVKTQQAKTQIKRALEDNGLPSISINEHHLPTLASQSWEAIHKNNGGEPSIFRYGNALCRVELSDYGTPVLKPLTIDRARHILARVANWFKFDRDGNMCSVYPPDIVIKDVLATPDPSLPILLGVTGAPVFAPDGTLQIIEGYNEHSQLYYAPARGFNVDDIPPDPSTDDIERAKSFLFDEILCEFPFHGPNGGESERAHAAAMFLQPFVRPMIAGATPLYLIEKPTPGTGATLMVQALLYPFIGGLIAAATEGHSEEEWRKKITAKLQDAPAVFFVDNLRERLDSSALASVITSGLWEDRILGLSEMTTIQARCMWIATGNNPTVSQEIKRRCVRIRLDAQLPDPHLRAGFKHPKLLNWIQENRANLVWSALTMIQNWISQKMPKATLTLGMFDDWAAVLGGILEANDIGGFLGNLKEFYTTADLIADGWPEFLSLWWNQFAETAVKAQEVMPLASKAELDVDSVYKLGHRLSNEREKLCDIAIPGGKMRVRLAHAGMYQNAHTWKLEKQETFTAPDNAIVNDRPIYLP
jgi:DNA primase